MRAVIITKCRVKFIDNKTERAYAAFVKNQRYRQTIDLLDENTLTELTVVE